MIVTVTPNAAIDRTAVVSGFKLNAVNEVKNMPALPGGKGINVARVLKAFGAPVVATGFIGGETGKTIKMGLERSGVGTDFAIVMGESRTCLKIVDPQRLMVTELNELGPEITAQEVTKLTAILNKWSQKASNVVFSGSLPPGAPQDSYRKWVEAFQRTGGRAFVDARGAVLRHALEGRPYLVKPNQQEAEELVGYSLDSETRISQAVETFMTKAQIALITLGERGAAVGFEGERWRAYAPPIKGANPIGSGDAFLAGFIVGLTRQLPIKDCLRLATATGAANAQAPGAGVIRLEQVDRLSGQVRVEALRR
ncbi:MAG TPA: 1-phosphofructokinase family hexose kinase [Pantanalinema sp.]